MKKYIILIIFISAAFLAVGFGFNVYAQGQPIIVQPKNMTISSPAFNNESLIPVPYTCDGANAIPPLDISNVPLEAKSLAILVDDPDAPMGNFNHWIAWNIDPSISMITEKNLEGSVSGKNSAQKNGYVGPCPPSGTHRYFFKAYALDTRLDLNPSSVHDDLVSTMEGHILAEGELMGRYRR